MTMTPVLVLCILLCAASAASAQKESLPADVSEPQEEMMRMMVKEEEQELPEDLVPELKDGAKFQQAEEPEARCTSCPSEWYLYSGVCYKVFTESLSWYDAAENCSSWGAQLASVPSGLQYSFLQQLASNVNVKEAWLGGLYLRDQWIWLDGHRFIYEGWSQWSDYTSSPCLYLWTARGWTNSKCSTSIPYICAIRSGC